MIDTLLLLSNGFFKWEDGFRTMTVSCGKPGAIWLAGDAHGKIPENAKGVRLPSPVASAPAVCGFLKPYDDETWIVLSALPEEAAFLAAAQKQFPKKRIVMSQDTPDQDTVSPVSPVEPSAVSESVSSGKTELLQEKPVLNETFDHVISGAPDFRAVPESFWDCNVQELTRLLENNPPEEWMNDLIPGSRWVRVMENDLSYLAGVIYEDENEPLYLCFGFERPWSETPPEDLQGYCQWIPRDFSSPQGEGYWVIYSDAKTGARIR